jgi:CheY-like chemotaxis protein
MTVAIPKLDVRARILVIDDNEILARSFARMLRTYDTSVESDPRAALARIRAGERFEIVMCDLKMPHLSGFEVLDEIRAHYAKRAGMPHVVMMSGSDDLCEEELATPVLPKPCTATEVRAMVTRLLDPAAT